MRAARPTRLALHGLLAALRWLEKTAWNKSVSERKIVRAAYLNIERNPALKFTDSGEAKSQTATIGMNLEGMEPSTLGQRLDEDYGILCRVGLCIAPPASSYIRNLPDGCVRLSLGAFQSETDIYKVTAAIRAIAKEMHGHAIRGCARLIYQPCHAYRKTTDQPRDWVANSSRFRGTSVRIACICVRIKASEARPFMNCCAAIRLE
jgi:hypothetical protein